MGVAVPSMFYSIGELDSVANALQVMFDYQVWNLRFLRREGADC